MALKIGENVGSYRVISQLGQGGMATVYKAYHASLDRYVALKVLHPAFKEDATFHSRFQREARVLAKLEHPNIVPIHDFAEHEGQPYLVMKYIEGDTLKSRLSNGPATLAETLQVVDAVGSALAYAHQQGILHRDIKPSNIIITHDGTYYLSDFGLARIASVGESSLSQDTLLGTPNYISPEQAKGQADLDGRTDIYSFGVVLYEMVVGRTPFSGDTPFSVIHDHIYSPLPPPSVVNPNVSEPLEMFLLKALAKDRNDRFPDATSLVAAFHQAVGEQLPGTVTQHSASAPAGNESASIVADSPVAPTLDPTQVLKQTASATVKAPSAAATVQARKEPPAPAAESKKTNWLLIGGIGLVVLLLGLAGLWAVVRALRNSSSQTPTAVVQNPPPSTDVPPTSAIANDAITNAQATLAVDLNSTDAHLQLGRAYYEAGRINEALSEYNKAAQLSDYRALFYQFNVITPYHSDPLFALTVLSDGLRHTPDKRLEAELWLLSVPLFQQVAALPNSEPLLQTLSQDFPDRAGPQAALIQHYILFNQLDQAEPLVGKLLQKYPNEPMAHFVNGEYLIAANQSQDAIAEFDYVLSSRRASDALKQLAQKHIDEIKGTPAP